MTVIQAIVLGILQGIGEFLPISSSAHLVLVPYIFGWDYQGLAYDVMLHMGTLAAVLIYFAKDWIKIFKDAFARKPGTDGKMLWFLVAASIPASVFGFLLNDLAETAFRDQRWIALNLIFFSFFIFWADKKAKQNLSEDKLNLKYALLIGLAQCLALLPGASRSGMTIMAALFLGFTRSTSAKFSFLLSTPVIFGAGLFEALKLSSSDLNAVFAYGFLASFITGFAVIGFFMHWLKKHGLIPFIVYRVLLGTCILLSAILL